MHDRILPLRRSRHIPSFLILGALLALQGGCSFIKSVTGKFGNREPQYAQVQARDPGYAGYVALLGQFHAADPARRSEMYESASQAYVDMPTTANQLRLALLTGAPDHPASDPERALQVLKTLRDAPGALLPDETEIVSLYVGELEQRLYLSEENARLRKAIAASNSRPSAPGRDSSSELRAALAENERLQAELEAARAKLEAVTSIERTLERSDANGRAPQ